MRRRLLLLAAVVWVLPALVVAADSSTNKSLILGSWYCPSSDVFHRFDFKKNGTFLWLSYIPLNDSLRYWSPDFTAPAKYTFRSATEVQVGSGSGGMVILSLSKDTLRFVWSNSTFKCTRTPPPGDTAESRGVAAAQLQKQKRAFWGKWVSKDRQQYVEFLPNDRCARGTLQAGRWITEFDTSQVLHQGKDAMCGGSGTYSREGPNTVVLDFGMGGQPITFYRTSPSRVAK